MSKSDTRPAKSEIERLDIALFAVLAAVFVLAVVVVSGAQSSDTAQSGGAAATFVAR